MAPVQNAVAVAVWRNIRRLKPEIACILAIVIYFCVIIILNIVNSQLGKSFVEIPGSRRATLFAMASVKRIFVVNFRLFVYRDRVYNAIAEVVLLKMIIIVGLSLRKRVLYTLTKTLELKRLLLQVIEHVKKILLTFGNGGIHEVIAVLQLVFKRYSAYVDKTVFSIPVMRTCQTYIWNGLPSHHGKIPCAELYEFSVEIFDGISNRPVRNMFAIIIRS